MEVTGIDLYFGQGEDGNDDDEDENDDSDDSDEEGVQEFIKHRWNLNAPFRTGSRLRPDTFDLINSRLLMDGIDTNRWDPYVRELKFLLKPGAWLQMVELQLSFQSDSGLLNYVDSEPLWSWQRWYEYGMSHMRKDYRIGQRLGQLMTSNGFERVSHQRHRLQIGRWNGSSSTKPTSAVVWSVADRYQQPPRR